MKKILFISPVFPYPPNGGDTIRAFHIIEELRKKNEVYLICLNKEKNTSDYKDILKCKETRSIRLKKYGEIWERVKSISRGESIHVAYYQSNEFKNEIEKILLHNKIDLVYVLYMSVEPYVRNLNIPIILDLTDSLALNRLEQYEYSKGLRKLYLKCDILKTILLERKILKKYKNIVVCAERDKRYMLANVPGCNINIIPNIVDTRRFDDNYCKTEKNIFIFTGSMNYLPNVVAVERFVNKIFPIIKAEIKDAKFLVVGKNPSKSVQELAGNGVDVIGAVDDMRVYLKKSKIYVAPMIISTGTQNKILESMAMGIPTVTSGFIGDALGLGEESGLFLRDEDEGFARCCINLCENDEMRKTASHLVRKNILNKFSSKILSLTLEKVINNI